MHWGAFCNLFTIRAPIKQLLNEFLPAVGAEDVPGRNLGLAAIYHTSASISTPSFVVPRRQYDPSTPPCAPHQCATFELKFAIFVLGRAKKSLGTSLNTHLKIYTHISITYSYLALPCLDANMIRAHHRVTHTNAQLLN